MTDPMIDLAMTAAQELVKAMMAGLVDLLKRIPALWRHAGSAKETVIATELQRSTRDLIGADDEMKAQTRIQQEALWRVRLQDLLDEYPEAAVDLKRLLAELAASQSSGNTYNTQNVIAEVAGANAFGILNADGGQGNINIHHHAVTRPPGGEPIRRDNNP